MKRFRFAQILFALALIVAAVIVSHYTSGRWLPWVRRAEPTAAEPVDAPLAAEARLAKVIVNEQSQRNLGLTAKPLAAGTLWKTILVPGMIVDRPGRSDRGVVAPVAGVVSQVLRFPSDAVQPGEVLFTIRILSDSIQLIQTELFKAGQDISIAQTQRERLGSLGNAVAAARLIEIDNQITRLQATMKAYRQELSNRGFRPNLIEGIIDGKFVKEISVTAPPAAAAAASSGPNAPASFALEMQDLKVELGQQVQAGQMLCLLANHQLLAIEGRAFRDETALLEQSVWRNWPVEVDFQENEAADWPAMDQAFYIGRLANTIDPVRRTFAFLMPLTNQSRVVTQGEGRMQTLWRFRPGHKVRLKVRVAKLEGVFVLPTEAVVQDGPEAFVFTQNVNTFERKPIHVVFRDRRQVAIADDGSILAGSFVAQASAAQLNRMVKAGGGSGVPKGFHVHADGSLHKNEDEGE